jgi:alpha-L-rhamnosidase
MVPDGDNEKVFQHIVDKTMNENKGHISTGVIGTQWLMRWLTLYGRADIAFRLASIRDYPSWGYMVANGATTIWELWNGNTADPKMNSQNHVMLLGDLIVWFYENLGGIKTDMDHPAFKGIEMKPSFVNGLDHVKASYHSMYGIIKSSWTKNGRILRWNISVPGNTKAVVHVPSASAGNVLLDGKNPKDNQFILNGDEMVFSLGSGDYEFIINK